MLFITHQIDEAVYLADRVVVFSARPAVVKATIRVDIPRPRPLSVKRQPALLACVDEIWRMVEEEVRSGMVPRASARGRALQRARLSLLHREFEGELVFTVGGERHRESRDVRIERREIQEPFHPATGGDLATPKCPRQHLGVR